MSRHTIFVGAVLVVLYLCVSTPAIGQCVTYNGQSNGFGVSSMLVTSSTVSSTTLGTAAGMWNGCSGSGSTFPTFKLTGSADITISVELIDANCPDCGCGRIERAVGAEDGMLIRADIMLYTRDKNGNACDMSTIHQTLAHELGHALGLGNSSCSGYIMGPYSPGGQRTVQLDECSGVEQRWVTPEEVNGDDDHDHPCDNPPA